MRLFGLDIAAIVNRSIAAAGGVLDCTLVKVLPVSRDPGNLAGGTHAETASYAAKGILKPAGSRSLGTFGEATAGDLYPKTSASVLMLGASIADGAIPEPGDRVTIEGVTYQIEAVARDPAAAAYDLTVAGV